MTRSAWPTRWPLVAALVVALIPAVVGIMAQASPASGAELLMFEERGCVWCRRWDAEVGVAYPKTLEGRRAPLHRIDIHAARPPDLALSAPVRATPTFVLVEDGREIGRITGYPGADFFWGMLEGLMAKLEPEAPVAKPKGERAASVRQPRQGALPLDPTKGGALGTLI